MRNKGMTAAIMGLGIMTICSAVPMKVSAANDTITLRVCNWEEYIDEGGWDEDERIELPSGDIFGDRSLVEEFEDWYYENYGVRVKVEYSTFGTNEELYSQLNLGNVFDLVCPSDYMIMKLMTENRLEPLSDDFLMRQITIIIIGKDFLLILSRSLMNMRLTENLGQIMQLAICGASRE